MKLIPIQRSWDKPRKRKHRWFFVLEMECLVVRDLPFAVSRQFFFQLSKSKIVHSYCGDFEVCITFRNTYSDQNVTFIFTVSKSCENPPLFFLLRTSYFNAFVATHISLLEKWTNSSTSKYLGMIKNDYHVKYIRIINEDKHGASIIGSIYIHQTIWVVEFTVHCHESQTVVYRRGSLILISCVNRETDQTVLL